MRFPGLLILMIVSATVAAQTLKLDRREHHFGEISELASVTTRFQATNTGIAELIIEKVQPSCGCTAGDLERDSLQPGESTWINISFDPKGKRGAVRKLVHVLSNDTRSPRLPFFIAADVVPVLKCTPERIEFTFSNGAFDSREKTFVIQNNGTETAKLIGGGSTKPMVILNGPEAEELAPGDTLEFTVSLDENYVPDKALSFATVVVATASGEIKLNAQVNVRIIAAEE